MLKILFGLLLVINGGLLAYQQGYLDTLSPPSREPSRLTQQLNAEKLQLLSPPVQTDADAKAEAKPDAKATTVLAAVEPEKNLARADNMSNALVCAEVGNFDASEAKKFEAQLAGLALGERSVEEALVQPQLRQYAVWWKPVRDERPLLDVAADAIAWP